jgi:membrane protein implicated in regulation of membrane protease activity
LKTLYQYLRDAIAIIAALVFKLPGKTFNDIVGSEQDEYLELAGKSAFVTECVTAHTGRVRFSGCDWRARLSDSSQHKNINAGLKVTIESAQGNVLFVDIPANSVAHQ